MAPRAPAQIDIAVAAAVCVAAVLDVESYPFWTGGIVSVNVLERDPAGRPLTVAHESETNGRTMNYTLAYDQSGCPGRIGLALAGGDDQGLRRFRMAVASS